MTGWFCRRRAFPQSPQPEALLRFAPSGPRRYGRLRTCISALTTIRPAETELSCSPYDSAGKIVEWPEEVGEGGDVTDYFVRLKRSREEFLKLLQNAKPATLAPNQHQACKPGSGCKAWSHFLPSACSASRARSLLKRLSAEYVQPSRLRGKERSLAAALSTMTALPHSPSTCRVTPTTALAAGHTGMLLAFVQAMEDLGFAQALEVLDQLTSQQCKTRSRKSLKRQSSIRLLRFLSCWQTGRWLEMVYDPARSKTAFVLWRGCAVEL